jgi:predicted DCC family thiol-disulfide oxidoreductase YuxK
MTLSPASPPAADTGSPANLLPTPAQRPLAEVVIFDGNCQLCTAQVLRLAKWDTRGRLAFFSLHDPEVGRRYPQLTHEALMRDMVVVDRRGRFHHGAAAVRQLARRIPRLWPLVPWLYLPGTMPLWQWLYRQVADRRYRFNRDDCDGGTCHLHGR